MELCDVDNHILPVQSSFCFLLSDEIITCSSNRVAPGCIHRMTVDDSVLKNMTIKEIAEMAKVSTATVSKILNHKDQNINPETRKRVLDLVKQYKYTPYGNLSGGNGEEFLIGVIADNSEDQDLIRGISDSAREHGYGVLIQYTDRNEDLYEKQLRFLLGKQIKGLIVFGADLAKNEAQEIFTGKHIQVCVINGNDRNDFRFDLFNMAYDLTEYLFGKLHTCIACVTDMGGGKNDLFAEGYRKCFFDHKINYSDDWYIDCRITPEKLIHNNFTAAVSSNYNLAADFYSQCRNLHFYVPDDVSILTLQRTTDNNRKYPRIGGIILPSYELGNKACENLINKIENIDEQETGCLITSKKLTEPEISVREACGAKKNIIVVGSINVDNNFFINSLPQGATSERIQNSHITPGGKGLNQAVALARLGCKTALVGAVGKDEDSLFLLNHLKKEGVSVDGIHMSKSKKTGQAYIYVFPSGASLITLLGGANDFLTKNSILRVKEMFKEKKYCLISTEIPMAAVEEAACIAKEYGAVTILKPSSVNNISELLYRNTDLFVPSLEETEILCKEDSIEKRAAYFRDKGVRTVIVMCGNGKAYVMSQDSKEMVDIGASATVDATGEPDAFCAALAAYLMRGYPLVAAVRIALYAARYCIMRQGVPDALPTTAMLEAMIALEDAHLLKMC